MGKLVLLQAAKSERNASVEVAWQRYVSAQDKAKTSLKLEDGIAAGKAYAEFVRLFERAS